MRVYRHFCAVFGLVAMLCLLAACNGSSSGGSAAPSPTPVPPPPAAPTIALAPVFSGLSLQGLVALQQAPGDSSRWFAVERRGMVWVFENNNTVSTALPFIDIRSQVESGPGEAGLLGMAFHPGWGAGNFTVFLSYTRPGSPLQSTLSRFDSSDNGATLDNVSEQILLTLLQDQGNHNGGNIVFGSDGYLYAGWGDGGGAGDPLDRAQDTHNLLGAITRIDVDNGSPYGIPADNPFAGNARCSQGFGSAACAEIYAWGFRNPWRWSFDRATGELWVGDVGQGAIEEVDRVQLGGNYGWRCREGSRPFDSSGFCPTGLIDPVTEYEHNLGQSITGGYVYRGSAITALQGFYVFADFVSGRLFAVPASSATGTEAELLLDTPHNIASFAEDSDGELYLVDFGGGIYQLVADP